MGGTGDNMFLQGLDSEGQPLNIDDSNDLVSTPGTPSLTEIQQAPQGNTNSTFLNRTAPLNFL